MFNKEGSFVKDNTNFEDEKKKFTKSSEPSNILVVSCCEAE